MSDPGDPGGLGPDGPGRAWGWVAALRAGSTTPWSQWLQASGPDSGSASPTARDLPGAQQLELLRRVNLARHERGQLDATSASASSITGLAERIVTASSTGRGAPDLELVGAAPERSWGLPPIDPADLTDHDLLRVAATLLAEDLVAADLAAAGAAARGSLLAGRVGALPLRVRRRLLRRRDGHRIVGDPWLALTVRDEMLRAGRPLGGPESTVVVVGQDAATMLVGAFTTRSFDEGAPPWERWLHSGSGAALPRRADLAAVARRWSGAGSGRVVVVPDVSALPSVLGLPAGSLSRLTPPQVSADAVDLARRVSASLGLLVPPAVRRRLLRQTLLPILLADDEARRAAPLTVAQTHLPWVVRRAEKMRDDLRSAGYPVVGDLQNLVPAPDVPRTSGAGPDDAGVLALAVRLLLAGPASTAPAEKRESR